MVVANYLSTEDISLINENFPSFEKAFYGSSPNDQTALLKSVVTTIRKQLVDECSISTHSSFLYFLCSLSDGMYKTNLSDEVWFFTSQLLSDHTRQTKTTRSRTNFLGERVCDTLEAISYAQTSDQKYELRLKLGKQMLALTGLFPRHLQYSQNRFASPTIRWYEELGSTSFSIAGSTQEAKNQDLEETLLETAESFNTIRLCISDAADRYMRLGDGNMGEVVLNQNRNI